MRDRRKREPLCETSEPGERVFTKAELLPIGLGIGQRILEVFGYQEISKIVFRLKTKSEDVHAVIDGEELPSVELLLAIRKITGASIDWLLTGEGQKYLHEPTTAAANIETINLPTAIRSQQRTDVAERRRAS